MTDSSKEATPMKIAPMTKSQMLVRLASHPDEFQTHHSLPLSRLRLFCWTTYFQGYLKCNCVT
jgi:hypothetical protein